MAHKIYAWIGMKTVGRIRLFPSVRYCILPSAVWCGAVHTFSHTRPGGTTHESYVPLIMFLQA